MKRASRTVHGIHEAPEHDDAAEQQVVRKLDAVVSARVRRRSKTRWAEEERTAAFARSALSLYTKRSAANRLPVEKGLD